MCLTVFIRLSSMNYCTSISSISIGIYVEFTPIHESMCLSKQKVLLFIGFTILFQPQEPGVARRSAPHIPASAQAVRVERQRLWLNVGAFSSSQRRVVHNPLHRSTPQPLRFDLPVAPSHCSHRPDIDISASFPYKCPLGPLNSLVPEVPFTKKEMNVFL